MVIENGWRSGCSYYARDAVHRLAYFVHDFTVQLFYSSSSSSLTVRLLEKLPLFELESGFGAGWMFIFFLLLHVRSCAQSRRMGELYVLGLK
jgi:hypothetical protein